MQAYKRILSKKLPYYYGAFAKISLQWIFPLLIMKPSGKKSV
jgi:hypothetical protein